ncbi:MAG: PDZ domain-containing protein [Phycisphaerales bacterium]
MFAEISADRHVRAGALVGIAMGALIGVGDGAGGVMRGVIAGAMPRASAMSEAVADPEIRKNQLNKQIDAAFDKSDYVLAESLLRELIKIDGENFVPWYNLACALSMQGRTQDAGPALEKSIELGFSDLGALQSDPHLVAVRRTSNYRKIVASWNAILDARIESNLQAIKKTYGPSYTAERDESLRLAYVSAFAPGSFENAKKEVKQLTQWWEATVATPVTGPTGGAAGVPGGAAGDAKNVPWVLVVLPSKADYQKWAMAKFGSRWQQIGGSYSHDEKKLVAKDIGSTLRHEYWHVLHWRDMTSRRQQHPIWIMEGLCSLPEDIEITPDGSMKPIGSWRTNQARKLAVSGNLMPWDRLFEVQQKQFIGSRPLAYYAQARCVFLFLWNRGKLKAWYEAYTAGYAEDPSGKAAMEKMFGKPLKDVQKEYAAWLRSLPVAPEEFRRGDAVLPFDLEEGEGDGVVVSTTALLTPRDDRRGSPRDRGGIRFRDVITAIDDKPVREIGELIQVLAPYMPGAEVEVSYRRGRTEGTAKVKLVAY